jgi:DeoR/GlpR family transcriptional regulator of sugar metabolism
VILLADHTKFGLVSKAFLAPVEDVHMIVTDNSIDRKNIELFQEKEIEVIVV